MAKGEEITTKFRVDVSELKKGISTANKEIEKANAQFKAASAGMDKWNKSSEGINAKLKQLGTLLQQEKSKLENYTKQLQKQEEAYKENGLRADQLRTQLKSLAEQGVSKTDDEYRKLQKSLTQVEKEQLANENAADKLKTTILNQQGTVNKLEKDYKNYNVTLKQVEKAEKTAAKTGQSVDEVLKDMEKSTEKASEGFTVMKGALASLVADGIRKALGSLKDFVSETITVGQEFDSSMSKVGAVSGATGDELDRLRKKAKEMGATTKFTASEAAEAFNYMAMAGWKTEDMLEGIEGILNLAAASGSDLATTSDIVTDALTAMGYSAKDAGKLADVMAAASSNANTNVEMMGQTFQYAAPIVGALGYKMEDTAVAIGLMANAGIKGEKAGTALRSILTRLSAPPKECADAMKKLGISITNTDGTMKPLNVVIGQLRKGFAGLSEAEQTQIAKSLAGQEAMSGLLAIVNAAPGDFDKLTKAVNNSNGAAAKMSKTMQDNLGGDLTKLKSQFEGVQITIYEKLEPALRRGAKVLSKLLSDTDWNSFGKNAGEALNKVIDGFEWIIKHKSLVVGTIKAIVAAFVISKVSNFTASLSAMGKQLILTATSGKQLTSVTKNMTAAQIANTTATNAGAVATNLFSAAWKANPIGVAITGITLLTAGFKKLVDWVKKNNEVADENAIETQKLIDKHKELNDSIQDNVKTRQDTIKAAGEEASSAEVLMKKLESLIGVEEKSKGQKEKIKQIVTQLNDLIPELNLKYDAEKDALNKTTEAIKKQITATKDLAKAKAAEAQLTEIAADMAKLELERADLIEQNTKNQEAYNEAVKKRIEFVDQYGMQEIANNNILKSQYAELRNSERAKKKALDESKTALDENTNSMNKLNKEYDKTSEYASKLFDQAEIKQKLSELVQLCEKAGVEIPEALKKGMEQGKYAIPKSVEELNKLISFDEALQEAELDGIKIPASISEGVISGKTSVKDAVKQVNDVVKFNEALEQAKKDGYVIPESLSENMLNGSISVKKANEQLNNYIEFNKALAEAKKNGIIIPKEFSNLLLSKAGDVKNANEYLNGMIDFSKALYETEEKGIAIPKELSTKLVNGKISVEKANKIINDCIKFDSSLAEAKKKGYEIPVNFSEKIKNGKLTVEEANTQMNNWIKFTDALKAANLAGIKIPNEIQQGILNGKMKPKEAIAQLNKNAKDEASKLPGQAKEEGKKVGGQYASGINNKDSRTKVNEAGKKLASEGKKGVKDKPGFIAAGEADLDGTLQGLSNSGKRKSIYSSLIGLGSNMLAKFKKALGIASPSKEFRKLGVFTLEGLSIGLKEESKPILNQVSNFGKSMINTLQDELTNDIELGTIKSNLQSGLLSAKSGLTNANVSTIGNSLSGSNVNKNSTNINNYTQIINAPKQPSRIELYRQTRNLLNYTKREG